jgi:uncharacterized protein YdhG (YjbR/CyaY superfamily)
MSKPQDVDSYIAAATDGARPKLDELRKIVVSTIPEAEEVIAWNVPIYRYHGQIAGFSTAKNHVSFGFMAEALGDEERAMLEEQGYKLGKLTLQIKFDQAVPVAIIEKILRATAEINRAADSR